MSCPWATVKQPETTMNFQEIMSEEIARDMQQKEDAAYAKLFKQNCEINPSEEAAANYLDTKHMESDETIAHMLQKQYDKEHDDELKRTQDKYNGKSKVTVSYCNYLRSVQSSSDDEEYELEDVVDKKDWDRFDSYQRVEALMPKCGYMKDEDGHMVTKHDEQMSSRKNTCRMMSFPPEFPTGDGAGFDLKLSNKVFNSLRAYSNSEQARRNRIHDKKEEFATAEFGLDQLTRILLYKMVNKGMLERINGIISIGKEAVVLHSEGNTDYVETGENVKINEPVPKDVVIKVFKTTLSQFKKRDQYINDDYRFKDRVDKQTSRKTINLWVEKEMRNLMRLRKCQIPCPQVIALKKHVLVMSMIGDERPAPKLKEVKLDSSQLPIAYEQIVDSMKKMYTDANLIHADLSEYNILYHQDQCWFIDVGQSVEPNHNNAYSFLMRDCENITKFFTHKNLEAIKTAPQLFYDITGFEYASRLVDVH